MITLDKEYYKEILNKYELKNILLSDDIDILFNQICLMKNINHNIIKEFLEKDEINIYKIYNNKTSFENICSNFEISSIKYIKKYIKSIKYFIKYIDKEDIELLKDVINSLTTKYSYNKYIVTLLKSLYMQCNKGLYNNIIKIKKIDYLIKSIKNEHDINKILNYFDNNKNINYEIIIKILNNELIIIHKNIDLILYLINKCKKKCVKKTTNMLEYLLYKNDNKIYDYIYFLENNENIINTKEQSEIFMSKLNYSLRNNIINSLKLKRGFIISLTNNDKEFILKYQPNKSIMELLINSYLRLISESNNYFLFPNKIFINHDKSYFYIIDKYDTDLYKYFNILNNNNKILTFNNILVIINFIIKSINVLYDNNIIHGDLKLDNIVVNLDNYKIKDIKIIDFDVSLFNIIPNNLYPIPEEYEKALNNKKQRGTRIYMLKDKYMSFRNDVYSLGVISIILLFKNLKLIINKKKSENNKKSSILLDSFLKKLNIYRNQLENDNIKIKILDLITYYLMKYDSFNFFDSLDKMKRFNLFKDFIKDCICNNLNIKDLIIKYNLLFTYDTYNLDI